MDRFAGTVRLLRLALRRDRIKIPVWLFLILGLTAVTVPALVETYNTPESRMIYATTMNSSMVGRMFGVLDGPSIGSILMVELSSLITLLMAFMAGTMIVRHTRHNEDNGSAELIESAPTGRLASLTSALALTTIVSLVIGLASGAILNLFDVLPTSGSWALGAIFAATGIVYGAVAAIAVQVAGSSRAANAITGGFIAVTFLLRAIGDMTGRIDNISVLSTWPSWLSPLGWGQQIHPFTQGNWWIFSLFAGFSLAGILIAYMIRSKRDLGAGMLPDKKGPANAGRSLQSPLGLAWRLQKTTLAWWLVIAAVMGIMYGGITKEFEEMLKSSDVIGEYLGAIGGEDKLIDAFLGMVLGLVATAAAAYVLQAILKARSEESGGRLESILGTATSRTRWLLSHGAIAIVGIISITLVTGLTTSISYVLVTGAEWQNVVDLTIASVAYAPALMAFWGVIVLLVGAMPRLAAGIGWALFVGMLLLAQLGALLKLPSWMLNVSPFSHIPTAPLEELTLAPLAILFVIATAFAFIGIVAFNKRDLATS